MRLDVRRRALRRAGDSGPAFVAGKNDGELLKRIATRDEKHMMPPDGPLEDADVAILRAWITQGAKWPDEFAGKEPAAEHWSFRPLKRPTVPEAHDANTDIDRFVHAKLKANRLSPSQPADKRTLIRRLHLDLIGLPPTPDEVEAFLDDTIRRRLRETGRPAARVAALRRTLGPALARPRALRRERRLRERQPSAPTPGGSATGSSTPSTPTCRSIGSRSSNSPATCLPERRRRRRRSRPGCTATRCGTRAASGDKEEFRTYAVKDRTDTTGTVWLGLTVGCAQCHTHKYDPISHREYYQLYAFFNSTDNAEMTARRTASRRPRR